MGSSTRWGLCCVAECRCMGSGSIHEFATFGNMVPTGLETAFGRVFVTQMGPIPHIPEDGKVVALRSGREPRGVARWASMLIDVERGPHGKLYGLSQGEWDGVGEGSRARPDTGRLVVVGRHGDLTPVVDGRGQETRAGPARVDGVRRSHRVRRVAHRRRLPGRRPLTAGLLGRRSRSPAEPSPWQSPPGVPNESSRHETSSKRGSRPPPRLAY
jgi:hypothetical protein